MSSLRFRRLDQEPADGSWNMAVDEALLHACADGAPGFPVVRFYRWEPACLSLGFPQEPPGPAALRRLQELGIDLVRRPTGGRAVLHDRELTYSVVAPCRSGPLAGPVMTTYRRISQALVDGLRGLGLPAQLAGGDPQAGRWSQEPCFARLSRSEIEVEGFKVVGSVQLQRRGCLLQHGSIPLRWDSARLAAAIGGPPLRRVRGVEDLLDRAIGPVRLADALARGFAAAFEAEIVRGTLTPAERLTAERLQRQRYRTPAWNHGRPRRRMEAVA